MIHEIDELEDGQEYELIHLSSIPTRLQDSLFRNIHPPATVTSSNRVAGRNENNDDDEDTDDDDDD